MDHVQENYESGRDVAEVLRKMPPLDTDTWRPRMQVNVSEDESAHNRENREVELDYAGKCPD